jgi:hypothetical protein
MRRSRYPTPVLSPPLTRPACSPRHSRSPGAFITNEGEHMSTTDDPIADARTRVFAAVEAAMSAPSYTEGDFSAMRAAVADINAAMSDVDALERDAASSLTLTRAEAYAISSCLPYTGGCAINENYGTRDGCYEAIRRLRLEATINDAGGWWGDDDPGMLDVDETLGRRKCPDEFRMAADGVPAIVELLPSMLALTKQDLASCDRPAVGRTSEFQQREDADLRARDEARMEALAGLATRLGVDLSATQPA